MELTVNSLPAVGEGVEGDLWFAADRGAICIDANRDMAWNVVNAQSARSATQKKMVVSRMRPFTLTNGTGPGGRYAATSIVDAGTLTADLWVTENQTGCTVMALDWGGGQYSMVHLQPSDDQQFNWLGRKVIGLDDWTRPVMPEGAYQSLFRGLYKNTWLSREMNWVVGTTGGTPQRYIMVQSMFESSRRHVTQVIGVRNGRSFSFYRQIPINLHMRRAEQLRWTAWSRWFPFFQTY